MEEPRRAQGGIALLTPLNKADLVSFAPRIPMLADCSIGDRVTGVGRRIVVPHKQDGLLGEGQETLHGLNM